MVLDKAASFLNEWLAYGRVANDNSSADILAQIAGSVQEETKHLPLLDTNGELN